MKAKFDGIRCIFHYDQTKPESKEPVDHLDGISPHQLLTEHDGQPVTAWLSGTLDTDGNIYEIFFDDGNEFSAYEHELEAIS